MCDYKIQNVVEALKFGCNQHGISIWGTEYYTYQGARRCELHFGNSDNNTIRFRLNNDDTIARALVTIQVTESSINTSLLRAAIFARCILKIAGMNDSEISTLHDDAFAKANTAFERNPYMTHYHEKTSLWCSSIQRYVVWDYEVTETHIDIYLYAHD